MERKRKYLTRPTRGIIPHTVYVDLQKEVLPFPVTKSIPELNIPEPIPQNPDAEEDPSTPDIDPDNLYNRIVISYTKAENRTFW